MNYKIFIDGSCLNIGKDNAISGWAYIVVDSKGKEIAVEYGKIRRGKQDSNRAELEALYQALKYIKNHKGRYTIYSDYEVIVKCMHGLCNRTSNRDIWENIERLCPTVANRIENVVHIESHQDDSDNIDAKMNNKVDSYAKLGANSLLVQPIIA